MSEPLHGHERSAEWFAREAERVLAGLPEWFRARVDNVVFFVEEFPAEEVIADMGLESPYDLLGLYTGVPLPERGSGYGYGNLPDAVRLYRRPILAYCADSGEDVRRCIRHVVIHELGHYLGLSDEEMERMERGQD